MKIVICDDNLAFARELLKKIHLYCAKKDLPLEYEIITSPSKLLASDMTSVHAAFLDIDMPGINGMEAARQLRKSYPDIIIVFVTAWIEYAPEGYSVNALRYILKGRVDLEIVPCMDAIVEKLYENTDTIHVRQQDRVVDIVVKDILYFEGTPKRAIIMHTNSSPSGGVECTGKLTEFEAQLSGKGFLRIHKSFLVNMAHINKIKNYKAVLDTGVELKVSEQKYSDICKQYVLWRGQII